MTRNREDTAQRLIAAALDIARAEGFQALGINAVARQAGADKQLIYRYFGNLDGLLSAAGAAVATRLASALDPAAAPPAPSYGALMARLALALMQALGSDQTYRQLRLMEASAPSPATDSFKVARAQVLQDWVAATRGTLTPPPGTDTGAAAAALIAMVEGLAILGPAGMDPADPATERRLQAVLLTLCAALYGA